MNVRQQMRNLVKPVLFDFGIRPSVLMGGANKLHQPQFFTGALTDNCPRRTEGI